MDPVPATQPPTPPPAAPPPEQRKRKSRPKRIEAPTTLFDTYGLVKLREAADAIGMDVGDLIRLAVDNAPAALGDQRSLAVPGLVGGPTLRELGKALWSRMQGVGRNDRPAWFKDLSEPQQIAVIVMLREQGYRTEVIAGDFGIATDLVHMHWQEHADKVGSTVLSQRLSTIAGSVQIAAERSQQGLMESEDWKGFWQVERDKVKVLQDLGIVDRAVHKVEVSHTFDGQKQAEIDAMLELERLKLKRTEEIKQAEARVLDGDPVPQLDYLNQD